MILRLWLRIFLVHTVTYSLISAILIVSQVQLLGLYEWQDLLRPLFISLPFWAYILAFILALAIISSLVFARGLASPYEDIHARINWLILGKYQHPSFSITKAKPNWYQPFQRVDADLIQIRDKMVQLSTDLQEFSAAPIFVGNETKEEIIEKERQRIARELHDSVSQQLFASMMLLSAINESAGKGLSPALQKQLSKVEEIINNAQTEMRALLLHLRPVELADKSLKEGILQLLQELKPKIPQEVVWELEEIDLDSGIEDHLFRIVQEAISNTLRHAKASRFEIFLGEVDQVVELKISDDGKGFDVEGPKKVGSYGLTNMQERISSLGGSFKIISLSNQGTVIDIKIPINNKRGAV